MASKVAAQAGWLEVAPGVLRLPLNTRDAFNVYLVGRTLFDAGLRSSTKLILAALDGHPVSTVVLTHSHPDHQGAASAVCKAKGAIIAAHTADREAMEKRFAVQPHNLAMLLLAAFVGGPPHPVERELQEGDELEGFSVLHVPGHTPGHLAFWRASDRVLITGDVVYNFYHPLRRRAGLTEGLGVFHCDREQLRRSRRRLMDLEAATWCPGHGRPFNSADVERFAASIAGHP